MRAGGGAWMGRVLPGVALALALGTAPARAAEVFTFSVPTATNLDMDASRMAGILAGPEVEVVLFYRPLLAIPGITGHFGYCSPRHVCVKGDAHLVVLQGKDVQRTADSLRVSLPSHRWFGLMPYRLDSMIRVTLPPFWPGDQAGNIDILDDSDGRGPGVPVIDMHLAAPYVGVAAYRIDDKALLDAPRPWAVPPCDATLALDAAGTPTAHPEHLALVEETWLRRLADSAWWAAQIPGVRFDLLGGLPDGTGPVRAQPRVVRVTVDRDGHLAQHLRARVGALAGTQCPGITQYEFSWSNHQLLDASISETSDIFGPEQCPVINRQREAQWWQGRLVSYTGPLASGELGQWSAWKMEQPACQGEMTPVTPDVSELQRAAALWYGYAQTAPVLPPEKDAY